MPSAPLVSIHWKEIHSSPLATIVACGWAGGVGDDEGAPWVGAADAVDVKDGAPLEPGDVVPQAARATTEEAHKPINARNTARLRTFAPPLRLRQSSQPATRMIAARCISKNPRFGRGGDEYHASRLDASRKRIPSTDNAVSPSAPLDVIRRNNLELIKGVQRATSTTVSALRTAVIVPSALADQ
jgi:hypothetical protein